MSSSAAQESKWFIRINVLARFDGEVGRYVAGSPELDVWSSGETAKEALDRAQEAILLFLEEATEMRTIWGILEEAGFKLQPRPGPDSVWQRLRYLAKGDFFPIVFPVQPPPARATG